MGVGRAPRIAPRSRNVYQAQPLIVSQLQELSAFGGPAFARTLASFERYHVDTSRLLSPNAPNQFISAPRRAVLGSLDAVLLL